MIGEKEELIKKSDEFIRNNPFKAAAAATTFLLIIGIILITFTGSTSAEPDYSDEVVLDNYQGISEEQLKDVDGWNDLKNKSKSNESEINISTEEVEELKDTVEENQDEGIISGFDRNIDVDQEEDLDIPDREIEVPNYSDQGEFDEIKIINGNETEEYENTGVGELGDTVRNLRGNPSYEIIVENVKYGYRTEDKPFIDVEVRIEGLAPLEDFDIEEDVKKTTIITPSGKNLTELGKKPGEFYGGDVQKQSLIPTEEMEKNLTSRIYGEMASFEHARAYWSGEKPGRLEPGWYQLNVEFFEGGKRKAAFYIPNYETVKMDYYDLEIKGEEDRYNLLFYSEKELKDIERFSPERAETYVKYPNGDTKSISVVKPKEEKNKGSPNPLNTDATPEYKATIPVRDQFGKYEIVFESEEFNKTIKYGEINFEIEKPSFEIRGMDVEYTQEAQGNVLGALLGGTPIKSEYLILDTYNPSKTPVLVENVVYNHKYEDKGAFDNSKSKSPNQWIPSGNQKAKFNTKGIDLNDGGPEEHVNIFFSPHYSDEKVKIKLNIQRPEYFCALGSWLSFSCVSTEPMTTFNKEIERNAGK